MRPIASSPRLRSKPTLLIVGCGDVGSRVLRLLGPGWRALALTTQSQRLGPLRALGAVPLLGDLDDAASLARLAALADAVLHLAPPPRTGDRDTRTTSLLRTLAQGGRVRRLVYVSTTGVYGDCAGEWIDETQPCSPMTSRAQRRVDAEGQLRRFGRASGCRVTILRAPGIYGLDRPGGDPRERLSRQLPVLTPEDDVFTNHIQADDLARACIRALSIGRPQRVVNVCDDTQLRMGDYFDLAADLYGCERPPRVSRAEASRSLSPMQLSFMSESRRIRNTRCKRELRLKLAYPTVLEGLRPCRPPWHENADVGR